MGLPAKPLDFGRVLCGRLDFAAPKNSSPTTIAEMKTSDA
jgi:hypothetical protein